MCVRRNFTRAGVLRQPKDRPAQESSTLVDCADNHPPGANTELTEFVKPFSTNFAERVFL